MRKGKRIMTLALVFSLIMPEAAYAASVPMTGIEAAETVTEGTGPALDAGLEMGGTDELDAALPEADLLAGGPSGSGLSQEKQTAVADNYLEYEEISDRIEYFNKDYKNTKTTIYSMTMSLGAADDLAEEASYLIEDALDVKEDDMDSETRALYEGYKEAARELRKQAQKLTNGELSGSYERTLRQVKNQLTQVVQNLLLQYHSVSAKAALAMKNADFAQASLEMKQTMAATGRASADELLAAENTLYEAQSAAIQAQLGAETLKSSILILLGWPGDAPVEFAPLDEGVLAAEEVLDLEADQKAAIGANSDLMSIRTMAAGGAAERTVKKRNVAMTADSIRIRMEQLYGARLAERQRYLGACAEKEAAELTMEAARKKHALGMTGRLEYLGAELSFLNAQANYVDAAAARMKSIEDYNWAVKGLMTGE